MEHTIPRMLKNVIAATIGAAAIPLAAQQGEQLVLEETIVRGKLSPV